MQWARGADMSISPHNTSNGVPMSFNLSIGAASPLLSSLSPLDQPHAEAGAAGTGHVASYDDGNWCGTVPHKFPFPSPPPPLGGIGGSIGDALQNLPGIGGNLGDALQNLPPISGNVADVLRDVLCGGQMHI